LVVVLSAFHNVWRSRRNLLKLICSTAVACFFISVSFADLDHVRRSGSACYASKVAGIVNWHRDRQGCLLLIVSWRPLGGAGAEEAHPTRQIVTAYRRAIEKSAGLDFDRAFFRNFSLQYRVIFVFSGI
jgi:hypothetical protein